MTAQINDRFHYRQHEYTLAGISEGQLFVPSLLDLRPYGTCTACYRGYQAVFGLSGSRLVLDTLHVNLPSAASATGGPVINGVRPRGPRDARDWFNAHYHRLNYHLEYTGGLLLASGFLEELYVHMGFHPAWKYEQVLELIFQGGLLVDAFDRSASMAALRQRILNRGNMEPGEGATYDEIGLFVERAFDRRYRF